MARANGTTLPSESSTASEDPEMVGTAFAMIAVAGATLATGSSWAPGSEEATRVIG